MSAPGWTRWLLRRTAPSARVDDVLGDLEEAHATRVRSRSAAAAAFLTSVEALDVARALLSARLRGGELHISLLDLKLSFRMLLRYPGLTLVAGLSMAFAIWASASVFEFFQQVVRPTLPLDDGDRIVTLTAWEAASNREESRITGEFLLWRRGVESIEDFGAYKPVPRNLVVGEAAYTLSTADITASAFRLARVAPLHGRFLVDGDEQVGAPPVIVLGFRAWQDRFAGDPNVVGRPIRLGSQQVTVVGVMPEGFTFPVNHQAWTPLRLETVTNGARAGPEIGVFGRLAEGATLARARTEVAAIAARASAPDERIRTDVVPYGSTAFGVIINPAILLAIAGFNALPLLLLLLISVTVALLMFARAAARESELVVRSALGASRRRIVGQLFVEALVLGGAAAAVGLAATGVGLRWLTGMFEAEVMNGQPLPFWFRDQVSMVTIVYTAALTVLGALVAGAGPGLLLTRRLGERLKTSTAWGGGARLGGVWTAVIVAQVAFTVVFPTIAVTVYREGMTIRNYELGIPDEEFLSIQVRMDRQVAPSEAADTSLAAFVADYRASFQALEGRLSADPAVLGVTYAERLPRTYHGWNQIEVDAGAVEPVDERGHRVARAAVDLDYFDVLGAPATQGRGFAQADLEPGARLVLVDQPFVDRVMGGANPIGRRIRYVASEGLSAAPVESGPWYEIVGLAPDLAIRAWGPGGIYHPTLPGVSYPLRLVLHVRGDPDAFVPRVRAAAAAVDSRIRLYEPLPLAESTRISEDAFYDFWITLAAVVSGLALLISLAAIYSVTAFTVVRRTREIGVRVALGGGGLRIVGAVLRRPLAQVGAGIAFGLVLTFGLRSLSNGYGAAAVLTLTVYGLLMAAVCAAACIVPTRRALAVEPTEALGVDV